MNDYDLNCEIIVNFDLEIVLLYPLPTIFCALEISLPQIDFLSVK